MYKDRDDGRTSSSFDGGHGRTDRGWFMSICLGSRGPCGEFYDVGLLYSIRRRYTHTNNNKKKIIEKSLNICSPQTGQVIPLKPSFQLTRPY